MKIVFKKPHKSIGSFADVELSNFTVLTGVNGAGKTHLLEAIQNGCVVVDGLARSDGQLVYFNTASFLAGINIASNAEQRKKDRESALNQINNYVQSALVRMQLEFGKLCITRADKALNFNTLVLMSVDELEREFTNCTIGGILIDKACAKNVAHKFLKQKEMVLNQFYDNIKSFGSLADVFKAMEIDGKTCVFLFNHNDVSNAFPMVWTQAGVLNFELANWFVTWQVEFEYNKFNRFLNKGEGDVARHFLEDEEFRKRYGTEPWVIANEVLASAGIRYAFNHPNIKKGALDGSFVLKLIGIDDGIEINTSDLSSGEKVLLAIALMLHQTNNNLSLIQLPRLLLLDEVDAPLHPAFTKIMLNVLNDQFVKKLNVSIIMTTHSPSTVALCNDDSVYELSRNPREIRKISQSSGAQVLSSGYVSITRSDTIVITESSKDPLYYQEVYQSLVRRGVLSNVTSLKFIAASKKHDDSYGGGCEQVKNWAPKLHSLGLERFRGLVDNDGKNEANSVVSVLKRYSVENYIFDPLVLTGYLASRAVNFPNSKGEMIPRLINQFNGSNVSYVQQAVDDFIVWVSSELSEPVILSGQKVICDYIGFKGVEIPAWWIITRGHDLEKLLRGVINKLGESQGRGALIKSGNLKDIILFKTQSYPDFISSDIVEVFNSLQT